MSSSSITAPKQNKTTTAAQIFSKLSSLYQGQRPPWILYSEVKSGPSWGQGGQRLFIMDAVAIKCSWSRPCIEGFEIKVNRADFLRDKKWPHYRKYCHKLNFVCPPGVVNLDDLSSPKHGDIGLLYYFPEFEVLQVKRRAMYRKIDMRSAEVVGMLLYLTMYRGDSVKQNAIRS